MAYISTVYPKRKNIVIVVDHGNSLSMNQLNTAKSIAKYVLSSLSATDRVSPLFLSKLRKGACVRISAPAIFCGIDYSLTKREADNFRF